jgi:hypothetical protein
MGRLDKKSQQVAALLAECRATMPGATMSKVLGEVRRRGVPVTADVLRIARNIGMPVYIRDGKWRDKEVENEGSEIQVDPA